MLDQFRTYQLSVDLYRRCQGVKAPHHLKDQLLRASSSVTLNLAEGSAKPTPKERRRFYTIALASCREVQAILMLANDGALQPLADKLGAHLYRLVNPRPPTGPGPLPEPVARA